MEISLAHHGILFLDELAEYRRDVIEALRTPLEDGEIHILALLDSVVPARCTLIAAVNPCPCGWRFHPEKICRCSPAQLQRYANKLSGPILDQLTYIFGLTNCDRQFFTTEEPESSQTIRRRVQSVEHAKQIDTMARHYAVMQTYKETISEVCHLTSDCQRWLIDIANQEHCRPDQSVASSKWQGPLQIWMSQTLSKEHIAEAIGYRVTWRW